MTKSEIIEVIAEAVREETDEDFIEIGPETTANQVPGWDSIAHVRIVLNIGLRVGAEIDISKTYTAANIAGLAQVVEKALAANRTK